MAGWKRIGASLLCIALVAPAAAQPGGKVMRIVVPFAAGGAREVLARTFYSELGAALGQTAIIDNRPGAGGAIGTASVARAAPDGQTLIFAASSHNVAALLGANPPYDPIRDFAGVANIGMQSYVLMASAAVPAKNVAELLGYARANPGKLNYASAGHGSSGHLAMAYFASLSKLDMVHIPFKSTADAINDVLAARSHAVIVPNVGAIPFARDDRIGLLAPARTPKSVIEHINAQVGKLLKDPVILGRLASQGVEPRPLSPVAFERLIREDYEDMAKVVKAVGRIE